MNADLNEATAEVNPAALYEEQEYHVLKGPPKFR